MDSSVTFPRVELGEYQILRGPLGRVEYCGFIVSTESGWAISWCGECGYDKGGFHRTLKQAKERARWVLEGEA